MNALCRLRTPGEQIESQFPELRPAGIERLGEGWDDLVFRVNGRWAFHFPRRQVGADLVPTETALLERLPQLSLEVPRPQFVGTSPDASGWPLVGYQCIEGTTWCRADLNPDQRIVNASRLGRFLRELHDCEITSDIADAVPLDEWRRLDVDHRRAQAHRYLQRALDEGLLDDGASIIQFLDYDTQSLAPPRDDTLVHGDLYSRHLIVKRGANVGRGHRLGRRSPRRSGNRSCRGTFGSAGECS